MQAIAGDRPVAILGAPARARPPLARPARAARSFSRGRVVDLLAWAWIAAVAVVYLFLSPIGPWWRLAIGPVATAVVVVGAVLASAASVWRLARP